MPLSAGDKLGPYEILAPIGAGGMGEVYRARDPRLNRDVAIKISAERFNERFEREARAIAALNHPNICQVYDVGASPSGFGYMVMELIEGESPKGPLPLATALKYAGQIADALEAAHDKGIVHRDLKPANIKITPTGVVKVLDFGLAKVAPAASGAVSENSPTVSMGMTQAGAILGTAAYMSPEQARGEQVDKRADIWAFGVVLYEMLSGEKMYGGKTVSDVLAAVLIKEPDLAKVAPQVRKLLGRCLQKDPKDRLRDIADAMPMVEEEAAAVPASTPPPPRGSGWLAWTAAAVLALAAAALGYEWWQAVQPVDHPLVRLDVDLGEDVALSLHNGSSNVIISPDGSRIVYSASVAGGPQKLYIRRLDQPKAVELPGTGGSSSAFFSSGSDWVGFSAGGKVLKVSVEGGAAVPVLDASSSTGSSWGDDGNIVHGLLLGPLQRVSSAGGTPAKLADLARGDLTFAGPQVLPGSKAALLFLYHDVVDPDRAEIDALTMSNRTRNVVAQGGVSPHYVAATGKSGYLLYANKNTLFAAPFDLGKLEKKGEAVPVLDDVGFNPATYEAQYDVSRTGTLVYRKGGSETGARILQWVDASGKRTPLAAKAATYNDARLSPDGKRLAATVVDAGREDIQVYDMQRETWTNLTISSPKLFFSPAWSPDGQYVVFGSLTGMEWARSDGASPPQQILPGGILQPRSISPDGKRVAYSRVGSGNASQVWMAPLDSSGGQLKAGAPEQFSKGSFIEGVPVFSPDGKWLAYDLVGSGGPDVYVRSFPDNGGLWKVSNNGGLNPIWSRSGHELLYQAGDKEMAVGYSANGSTFVQEKPRVWLDKVGGAAYDLSPDGKRLVLVAAAEAGNAPKAEHEIVLIQNFVDELRRRVPAGK